MSLTQLPLFYPSSHSTDNLIPLKTGSEERLSGPNQCLVKNKEKKPKLTRSSYNGYIV